MTERIITTFEDDQDHILYGLDAWIEYLSDKHLPARASSIKRINKLIHSDRSTIQQLAMVIKKDPVLTLYVVRAAQLKHNDNKTEVKSILHAVTSLGYDGIEGVARELKPMSLNPTSVQQKRFLHAIATSHHAAYQVQEWMQLKSLPLIDESYLAALFYSVGFWALWLHAPLHMQEIQLRIHERNEPPMQVEKDILGCSMQMISQHLSKTWQLSELTQQAQDHSTSPSYEVFKKLHRRAVKDVNIGGQELRKLNHITQQKYFPIKLANWIALTAARGWYSENTLRNIDLISDYLDITIEQTMALVHSTCGKSSRDYFAPGIMSPACQLLFNPSDIEVHYKMGVKELASKLNQYPAPEVPMIKPIDLSISDDLYYNMDFYLLIESHLRASPKKSKFKKATQVLLALLQGLEVGLGVRRLALFSINATQQSLKHIQSIGFTEDHPMKNFNTHYHPEGLLGNICTKQNYTVYDRLSQKKLLPKMGIDLRSVCAKDFMLISIFKVNKPIALVYLDMQDQAITNFIRERCRHLCYSSSLALENF